MSPKLVVNGAAGRMGRRIVALAVEGKEFELAGAIEYAQCPLLGQDAGAVAGVGSINVGLSAVWPNKADVAIDFSLPQSTDATIENCVNNGIALVLGTTGLSNEQLDKCKLAARTIPVVQATNTSLGMNLLFATVGKVAKSLGEEYDIEIVEAHHRFKKDSPSGSALSLAESVCKETGRDYPGCLVHGREGKEALREKGTVGMHAIRGGDIIGQHSVIYSTLGETVTISHNAHSRDTFVRGALHAAKWILDKQPGLYDMQDVLGLKS